MVSPEFSICRILPLLSPSFDVTRTEDFFSKNCSQGAYVNYSASKISDLTKHFIRENWRLPRDKWGPKSWRYRVKGRWALYLKRSWAGEINKSWGLVFGTAKVLAVEILPAKTNMGHQSSTHGESLYYEPNPEGCFSFGYNHDPVW